jgi:hypothetical protein
MVHSNRYGDVVYRALDWAAGRYRSIEIIEAAPRALIDDETLDEIRVGARPYATLDGGVLTIRATNRTLVYRIVGRHPDRINHPHEWVMEWPD